MTSRPARRQRLGACAPLAVIAGIVTTALAVSPASAMVEPAVSWHSGPVPASLVSVSLGGTYPASAPAGSYRYTVAVRNESYAAEKSITVRLMLPPSVAISGADAGGAVKRGVVLWRVTVPARQQAMLHANVRGVLSGRRESGVPATVCAMRGDSGIPVACGTEHVRPAPPAATGQAPVGAPKAVLSAGLVVLAFAFTAGLAIRARRKGAPAR